jgi:hypothetical protein
VLTAGTVKGAEKEVAAIKQLYERLKISYI